MEIKIFDNAEEIAITCADIFSSILQNSNSAVLGLATGASPVPTYKELIKRYRSGEISFFNATTFNLDEYVGLSQNDRNSYYSFMQANLFNFVDIQDKNIHILNGNAKDIEKECADFDDAISAAGGIDIQLLGIGTNGHIGFNEPNVSFSEGTFKVKLTDSTRQSNSIYFTENAMPKFALTMGIGSIMKAKKIVLIATGSAKAQAIKHAVKGEVTPACPASILQTHKDCVFLIDKSAAALM